MKSSMLRQATVLALLAALISGVTNFLTKIAVTSVKNPLLYTTLKNSIVAILLVGFMLALRKRQEIISLSRAQWGRLIAIGIVGGSIPFWLYFSGLAQTSALNASLIHKTLFLWVALLAIPFLKEKMRPLQWVGFGAIFAANLLVGGFQGFARNIGELMIVGATILWAVENIIAKRVLRDVSSTTVAAARMVFGSAILFFFVSSTSGFSSVMDLNAAQWGWTLLTGALLFGYVCSWYAALKRAPATYVAALLVPATLVTNVLSAIFITHTFSARDTASSALFVTGVCLVVIAVKKLKGDALGAQPIEFTTALTPSTSGVMDGVLRCSRYAFGPNRLHYCGPDANREIASYIKEGVGDPGLAHLLKQFETMYPYLQHIAEANRISNPFNERVVEAYWIGNELLEAIDKKKFYHHLIESQRIKKRIGAKSFELVAKKLEQHAVPHHSFHVLDIWKRTGHLAREHTLESMDECRVSWGRVIEVNGPVIAVLARPLRYAEGKLFLGEPARKQLTRKLEATYDIEQLKTGDIVSIHWSVPCEVITPQQAMMLKKYTLRHIALANRTI